jgi:hypothetical protein
MGGGATPAKPTQADVNAGTGGGWLARQWDAAVAWLDKKFEGPKLTDEQRAEAGRKAIEMSRDLANSDNPAVTWVTKNSGLTGDKNGVVGIINKRNAELDAIGSDAPPPAAPPPKGPGR